MSPSNGENSNLVCVFCASHDSPDSSYNDAADILGKELASAGYGLVYGGGSRGLMGRVARAVDNNSGDVLGVMPRALTRLEGTTQVGRHILVDSMHERKSIMNDNAMAFIALPGGYGTFEELLEIVTWSVLSIHSKPIVVLNVNGYYNALKDLIDNGIGAGFIREGNRDIIYFCDTPQEAVAAVASYQAPNTRFNLSWTTDKPT